MAAQKINVVLGERVVPAEGAPNPATLGGFVAGRTTLRTDKGTTLETDLQVCGVPACMHVGVWCAHLPLK